MTIQFQRFSVIAAMLAIAAIQQCSASSPIHWIPLDEPGSGGANTSCAISPWDSHRMLTGGDCLGIGMSTDGGQTWVATYGLKSWEIGDITFSPADKDTVWAGTMSGPYVSTDGGLNWQERRTGMPAISDWSYTAPIEKVLFDPNDAHHLLAIGGSSRRWTSPGKSLWGVIWQSSDGGATWTRLTTLTETGASTDPNANGANIVAATFAHNSSTVIYAATDPGGLFVSEDGGKSWDKRTYGLPDDGVERIVADPKNPDTAYVSLRAFPITGQDDNIPGGIFKTTDRGKTWVSISNGLSQGHSGKGVYTANYKAFAVSPSDPQVMYANDSAWNTGVIYGTKDGGAHWTMMCTKQNIGTDAGGRDKVFQISTAYPAGLAMPVLTVDPHNANVVYGVGGEDMVRSLDGGKTWSVDGAFHPAGAAGWRGRGFSGLCCINFKFDPNDPKRAVLEAMDAGKLWVSSDGMQTWKRKVSDPTPWNGGDDVAFAGKRIYATFGQFSNFAGIGRSDDEGDTWSVLYGSSHGLPDAAGGNQPEGVYALPADPDQVWACINGKLYHSSDGGNNWKVLRFGEGAGWIAGDPRNPNHFYVTADHNVYETTNDVSFVPIGGPHNAGRITVDSLGRVYVAARRCSRSGLWRYDGNQWTRLWDDDLISNVAVDPTDSNRIIVISNDDPYHDISHASGVWISSNAGKSWSQENDGLGMLRADAIAFNPHNPAQVVYGSVGRGYFVANWPKSYKPTGTKTFVSPSDDNTFAAVDTTPPPGPKAVVISNGDMSKGTSIPDNWNNSWTGRGKITVSRDTTTFKSAPASLCVDSNGADAQGQASELIDVTPGTTFTLNGFVKSQGNLKVNVAVQPSNGSWTPISFIQAKYVQGDQDWTPFSAKITIPDGAEHAGIVLLIEGTGKAWLDDVTVTDVVYPAD